MRTLEGEPIVPVQVDWIERSDNASKVKFVLSEGKNRQIRRMCEALNLDVARLRRIAVGSVKLGMLQTGEWRDLTPEEVEKLLVQAGVKKKGGNSK